MGERYGFRRRIPPAHQKELEALFLDARVEKIQQPNRDELVFTFRTFRDSFRVLFSARANSPRVNFIRMRWKTQAAADALYAAAKRLGGAKLWMRQPGWAGASIDFDAVNKLGDRVRLTLAAEIMGKYSNVILIGADGKIIDALKRVDAEMTSGRLVLRDFPTVHRRRKSFACWRPNWKKS